MIQTVVIALILALVVFLVFSVTIGYAAIAGLITFLVVLAYGLNSGGAFRR